VVSKIASAVTKREIERAIIVFGMILYSVYLTLIVEKRVIDNRK
jgi:hypothetical protein